MIKFPSSVQPGDRMRAEVCLIGGGPAAISIALQLLGCGKKVIILAGGKWRETLANRELNRGVASPFDSHEPLEENRRRQFGGASAAWGGRCIPMDPIDFKKRPWVDDSEWPISYEDILPYYEKANALCEAGKFNYQLHFAGAKKEIIAGIDDDYIDSSHLERWSPPINFARHYRQRLQEAGNIQVLLDTHLLRFNCETSAQQISSVTAVYNNTQFEIVATQYVLAAGGIDNPRLLLASKNKFHPNGIGNQHDQVGRYYMAHINGVFAHLAPNDRRSIPFEYEKDKEGVYFRRRWWITEKAQQEKGLGNLVMFLNDTHDMDGHRDALFSMIYIAKTSLTILKKKSVGKMIKSYKELKPEVQDHLKTAVSEGFSVMPRMMKTMVHRFHKRRLPTILPSVENQYLGLYFQSEHLPNYNSTVSLSETEKDALGLPLPIVKVAFCDADYRTILEAHRMFMQRYRDSQAGGMLYDESVLMDYIKKRTTKFNSAAHHLGTTRMASSPDKGVVDGNCKVFGMDNLYVAGSSVFTTGSHVNPTLTLVALAIRLGDHLCQL